MSDKDILEKAIQKAIDGGWKGTKLFDVKDWGRDVYSVYSDDYQTILAHNEYPDNRRDYGIEHIIFNHEFAKAIAGDDWTKFLCDLVVEENPIQELAKWL